MYQPPRACLPCVASRDQAQVVDTLLFAKSLSQGGDRNENDYRVLFGLSSSLSLFFGKARFIFAQGRKNIMFTAYIDDSNMTANPVAMLGGWVGETQDWSSFTNCWADALWMRPRLRYFKLMEAQKT